MNSYCVLGTDGNEYGPATADQIRAWMAEGRLMLQSRARLDGTEDWKTLAEFPEFATPPAAPMPPAGSGPVPLGMAEANTLADSVLARDYHLDIGSCLGRGWDLMVRNFWPSVGAGLLTFVLLMAVGSVPFASLVLSYPLIGGLLWYFLKLARGQPVDIADVFSGFQNWFVPLMLFSVVGQLLLFTGFLLCILPGIYLLVAWFFFTPLLIMDRGMDFWPAMEACRRVVTRHWWVLFGFLLVQLLIALAGLLLCGVGLLIAFPWLSAATVYAYEDIFPAERPGTVAKI